MFRCTFETKRPQLSEYLPGEVINIHTFYIIDWNSSFRTIDLGGVLFVIEPNDYEDEEVTNTPDDLDTLDVLARKG